MIYNEEKTEKLKKEAELLIIENFKNNYCKVQPIFRMLGFDARLEKAEIAIYDLAGNLVGIMMKDLIMGGTILELQTPKGKLFYMVCVDGKSEDGGTISRNIIRLGNINKIGEENDKGLFKGRHISVELGMGELASSNIPRIEVKVIDPNSKNIITEFGANSYSFEAKLENTFGPWGNYIDGINRSISYNDKVRNSNTNRKCFMSFENVWGSDGHYIILGQNDQNETNLYTLNFKSGKTGTKDFIVKIQTHEEKEVASELLRSDRTKNLVDYVLNSLDTTLPGIRQYIMNNSSLMTDVKRTMDTKGYGFISETIAQLFENSRIPLCDLPNEVQDIKTLKKRA